MLISCPKKCLALAFLVLFFGSIRTPITLAQESEEVSVRAKLPASSDDFQVELDSLTPKNPVPQGTMVLYEIKYGSYLTTPVPLTIEAEWTLGTLSGDVNPSVLLLEYVTASAKNGYNNTAPIVDIANRKITWTINAFPADTQDQTVRFALKTPEDYVPEKDVHFTVKARVSGLDGTTPYSILNNSYRYHISPQPTDTPVTPLPSNAPQPTTPIIIDDVDMESVSTTSASIRVILSQPGRLTVRYGTTSTNLSERINALEYSTEHQISLPSLLKAKKYYFRFIATDENGNTTQSDVFTFTTAKEEQTAAVEAGTILITSNTTILHHPSSSLENDILVVPNQTPFLVQFKVRDSDSVKNIQLFLRNSRVLGFTNLKAEAATTNESTMQSIKPGIYTGGIIAKTPNFYDLYVKLFDNKGNITEQRLLPVKITPFMRVYEEQTNAPIEQAKVSLSLYNPQTRLYDPIVAGIAGIPNPVFTDQTGVVQIALPANKYRVEVSALGYVNKLVDFTLGASSDETYPTIELAKKPFSLFTSFELLKDIFAESANVSRLTAQQFAISHQFFSMIAIVIVSCFVLLTFIAFTARTHIPLMEIPSYILHHFQTARCTISEIATVSGSIHDERMMKPIKQARVLLLDAVTGDLITQVATNKQGQFHLKVRSGCNYDIAVNAVGYPLFRQDLILSNEPLHISLTEQPRRSIKHMIVKATGQVVGFFFEVLLLLSFGLEILLAMGRGWIPALPFLAISVFNVILWVFYLKHEK